MAFYRLQIMFLSEAADNNFSETNKNNSSGQVTSCYCCSSSRTWSSFALE